MMRIHLLMLFVATVGICSAQEHATPDRAAFDLKLFVNDSNFYEAPIAAGPYFVHEGIIQVYPGEDLYIAARLKNGMLQDMHVIASPKDSTKVIHVKFEQVARGRNHEQMMLLVHNPFEGVLHYEANMYLMRQGQWASTDVLPVYPHIDGFETWSDEIVTIALSGWKVDDAK